MIAPYPSSVVLLFKLLAQIDKCAKDYFCDTVHAVWPSGQHDQVQL